MDQFLHSFTVQIHPAFSTALGVEGKGLDYPVTGLCSAFLLNDAMEKHRQRIGENPSRSAESAHEEQDADLLLQGLESELGYDFSMPEL